MLFLLGRKLFFLIVPLLVIQALVQMEPLQMSPPFYRVLSHYLVLLSSLPFILSEMRFPVNLLFLAANRLSLSTRMEAPC